jgi:hypothetical protein
MLRSVRSVRGGMNLFCETSGSAAALGVSGTPKASMKTTVGPARFSTGRESFGHARRARPNTPARRYRCSP